MSELIPPKTILLVEDEAIIAMSEARLLMKHGYEVITAYDAEKGIAAAREERVDLVLMDIDLGHGKMDGTEAAEAILKEQDLPIVFCTSHAEKEYVDKVKGITRYGYVLKSSGEFVLIQSIDTAFELFSAHRDLKNANKEWNNTFNSIKDVVAIISKDHTITKINDAGCSSAGLPREELIGKYCYEVIHAADSPITACPCSSALESNTPSFSEHEENGRVFDLAAWPMYDEDEKEIQSFVHIVKDISGRRQGERQLAASERNLRTTLESIGDAVISTDLEGKVVRMNSVAQRLCGWKREDAFGRSLEEVFHIINADTRARADNPVEKVMRTGEIVGLANHTMLISRAGAEYQIADSAAPIIGDDGEINGVVLIFRDVTEEYEKARQLRESEYFLAQSQKIAHLGSWSLDLTENRLYWSDEVYRIFGLQPQEFSATYEAFLEAVYPEDRAAVNAAYSDSVNEGRDGYEIEHRVVHKQTGEIRWVREKCYHTRNAEGKIIQSIGMILDITERTRTEEALRKSEERYRKAQSVAHVGSWEYHIATDTFWGSEEGKRIYGFDPDTEDFTSEEVMKRVVERERVDRALIDLIEKDIPYDVEFDIIPLNSPERRTLRSVAELERDAQGNPVNVTGILHDITERKRTDKDLREALKEKDFLMRELNHRAKNNLSLVSSLISLKEAEIENDLSDLKHRIGAIGLVHEKLYQYNEKNKIRVKEYLQELLEAVFSSFTLKKVEIVNTIEEVSIHTNSAVPLGLAVNEIAVNTIKYGFKEGEEARFTVGLTEDTAHEQYVLTLSNTGGPFPEGIDLDNPTTFGLQLVSALVEQLGGTIELKRRPHPVFTIRFPLPKTEA